MLQRFIEKVRGNGRVSGFEAYLTGLQCRGQTGVPTMREAQLDYWTHAHRGNFYWII